MIFVEIDESYTLSINQAGKMTCALSLFVFALMVVCNKTLPQMQVMYQLALKEQYILINQT